MPDGQLEHETLTELKTILSRHANDRVLILGTMCCGKTTLLRQIPGGVDMDDELYYELTYKDAV